MRIADISATGRTTVMGILNITEDSFSDGGKYLRLEDAVAHARRLVAEGADIIDVGGESTRPGATRVPPAVERARVLPVIEALVAEQIPVSIDTMRAATAEAAVAALEMALIKPGHQIIQKQILSKILSKCFVQLTACCSVRAKPCP